MSRVEKPSDLNPDDKDEFLIPPDQPGSMMARLAPTDRASPHQLEFVYARAEWEVVRIDTERGVFLELRRRRS